MYQGVFYLSTPLDNFFLLKYIVLMFYRQLKDQMEKQKLTARELHAALEARGVKVSLWTLRKWIQGTRKPKKYVQDAVMLMLTS